MNINDKETIEIKDHNAIISKDKIDELCKKNGTDKFGDCKLQVDFSTTQDIKFRAIIEETSV